MDGSWLGLNVPWGKFGIHGTLDPHSVGWASSHGCIRMNNSEVAELYKIVPVGTKVTIVDGVYGPFGKGFRDLKSGMYGADVMEIQKKLKAWNLLPNKNKIIPMIGDDFIVPGPRIESLIDSIIKNIVDVKK